MWSNRFVSNGILFVLLALPLLILPQINIFFFPSSGFQFGFNIAFFTLFMILYISTYVVVSSQGLPRRITNIFALVYLIVLTLLFVFIWREVVYVPQLLGAPALYLLFANTILLLGNLLFNFSPRLLAVVTILILVVLPFRHTEHAFRTVEASTPDVEISSELANCQYPFASCSFQTWLNARPDLEAYRSAQEAYPVFLVSAEGGGIYAASHTFAFLEKVAAICASFKQHLFSISSVSGGAFGAALFALLNENGPQNADLPKCGTDEYTPRTTLAYDYFSPVLAGFIYFDIPQFFSPINFGFYDSADVLELSFEQAFQIDAFKNTLQHSWSPNGNIPALFFNTTNVVNGRSEIVSPFEVRRGSAYEQGFEGDTAPYKRISQPVSVSTGASLSARFPFITPSGRTPLLEEYPDGDKTEIGIFVDGGYVDNSGSTLTHLIAQDILEDYGHGLSDGCNLDSDLKYCNFVNVEGNWCFDHLDGSADCVPALWERHVIPIRLIFIQIQSFSIEEHYSDQSFLDPIRTLLAVREARGRVAKEELVYSVCGRMICHDYPLEEQPVLFHTIDLDALNLPLTWSIGEAAYMGVVNSIGTPSRCPSVSAQSQLEEDYVSGENNCTVYAIIQRLSGVGSDEIGE